MMGDGGREWGAIVEWAEVHGAANLIPELQPNQIYAGNELSTNLDSQMQGPLDLTLDLEPKHKPANSEIRDALNKPRTNWDQIAGTELAGITRPKKFTGKKRRKLLVIADSKAKPPGESWDYLSVGRDRQSFNQFRRRVNQSIKSLMVDHIDFIPIDDFILDDD